MLDVPPPDDGVRDIAAYGETWPPFFEWQRSGRRSRSCRSTSPPGDAVGLRKQDGRWMVTREHHSFPDKS
jgi:hypothetical protein